jgi:hypothetical protein
MKLLLQYRRDNAPLFMLSNGTMATSKWLISKFRDNITTRYTNLGECSFRAGGLTHMAAMGYDLEILRILGRWKSDAFEKYLRDHPEVLMARLSSKS